MTENPKLIEIGYECRRCKVEKELLVPEREGEGEAITTFIERVAAAAFEHHRSVHTKCTARLNIKVPIDSSGNKIIGQIQRH